MDEQIQKYYFTGHLTPKPPGTERAMCALGGYVYLANEAEWLRQQDATRYKVETARLRVQLDNAMRQVRSLTAEVKALKKQRRALKRAGHNTGSAHE